RFANEVLNKGVFEAEVKEKLDECFRGNVVRYEMRYAYPELGERDVFVSYFPIEGVTGIDRVACIVQDITERKGAEQALANMSLKVIEAEERERYRISMDLHEDIGQRLTLLAIEIKHLQTDAPNQPDLSDRMHRVWSQTLNILADVKASAHELHSPRLEYLSLAAVMRCFCREFGERKGVDIGFRGHGQPGHVPPDVSICLFRVLQEALRNGVKHSGERRFDVQFWATSNELHLQISDSGAGFDVEAASTNGGLGLIRMEQRLKLVKGTFLIESRPHGGTTIHARVPLNLESDTVQATG